MSAQTAEPIIFDQARFVTGSDPLSAYYSVEDELGSGGFGKVKLATHLLTGENVAIKIIDKRKIGADLPRVRTELSALTKLCHQNICRLYQHFETEDKFYVVMEYCKGGELFDYIVKKTRLEESEARFFFRQLVGAIAYVHSKGFAHRDLKPENLLLTDELHLKLIDFGLSAYPQNMQNVLSTCCGSPAYAAPELLQGLAYHGNQVDIWSMGILLYTLLCGALPFEDDNIQAMYRQILKGTYYEPDYLSSHSRDFLKAMLQTDPKKRISMKEVLVHPWMTHAYTQPLKWSSIFDKNCIDEDVAIEMARHYNCKTSDMIKEIKKWSFDHLTATYLILLKCKTKGKQYRLPLYRNPMDPANNVITSPTIHASLESNLDRSGIEECDSPDTPQRFRADDVVFAKPFSPRRNGNDNAYSRGRVDFGSMPHRPTRGYDTSATPVRAKVPTKYSGPNDENERPGSVRIRGPVNIYEGKRPLSIYNTPRRLKVQNAFGSQMQTPPQHRPRTRGHSRDRASSPKTPCDEHEGEEHTPRSAGKTPRLRQRLFSSMERKADKVLNLLTPRRLQKPQRPTVLRKVKAMVNVSTTSSNDPYLVKETLIKGFQKQLIVVEENGWKIFGKKKDMTGKSMTVELEIVILENTQLIGIQRRRVTGDSMLYKKVCEEVLQLSGI